MWTFLIRSLEWEITLSSYQRLLEPDQRMFAVPWSPVVPDLEANSFPAMTSSMPCSWMESLSLDLLFFLSIPCSDLTLIQGNAAHEVNLWNFILSKLKIWGEMLFYGGRKWFTHFWVRFCACFVSHKDFPSPKCAEVFSFRQLERSLSASSFRTTAWFFPFEMWPIF